MGVAVLVAGLSTAEVDGIDRWTPEADPEAGEASCVTIVVDGMMKSLSGAT